MGNEALADCILELREQTIRSLTLLQGFERDLRGPGGVVRKNSSILAAEMLECKAEVFEVSGGLKLGDFDLEEEHKRRVAKLKKEHMAARELLLSEMFDSLSKVLTDYVEKINEQ